MNDGTDARPRDPRSVLDPSTSVARRPRGLRRWATSAATAIAASIAIAACGSGAASSSSASGHPSQAQVLAQLHQDALRFARCMRSHGVSNFPDPTSPASDKEFLLGQIPGINPQSPAFESADGTCKHLLPSSAPVSHGATAHVMAQLLPVSRCMRAHGLTAFPDPTSSAPSNQSAYLAIIGFGGPHSSPGSPPVAYLAVPNSIKPSSPVAEHAAAVCHFRLR